MPTFKPRDAEEVSAVVTEANASGGSLRIVGGGSNPVTRGLDAVSAVLDLRGLSGIVDYDPDELVLTAQAGTPIADVNGLLREHGQMLAFDPFDHGPVHGLPVGHSTLGGVVAANVSGPRRLSAGAARDHVLGFSGLSGAGETFKGGGRVVKNVTGFDLPKLMAGSWGSLAVLTSVTLRVLPLPRTEKTLVYEGLSEEAANRLMTAALCSPAAVSCAAHSATRVGLTLLRLEGFGPSVDARCRTLESRLEPAHCARVLEADASALLWDEVRSLAWLPVTGFALWRLSVPPALGWQVGARLTSHDAQILYDWGGGLVWVALPDALGEPPELHTLAHSLGGHARLIRAASGLRELVGLRMTRDPAPVTPAESAARMLRARIKATFDPRNVLNPGLDPGTLS